MGEINILKKKKEKKVIAMDSMIRIQTKIIHFQYLFIQIETYKQSFLINDIGKVNDQNRKKLKLTNCIKIK